MIKTKTVRLNNTIRANLIKEAEKLVLCDPTFKQKRDALLAERKTLWRMGLLFIKHSITEDEIKVLSKFGFHTYKYKGAPVELHSQYKDAIEYWKYDHNRNVYMHSESNCHYVGNLKWVCISASNSHQHNPHKYIRLPITEDVQTARSGICIDPSHMFWKDVDKYEKNLEAFKKQIANKMQPYRNLIKSSTTTKQLLEVWPEAIKFLPTANNTAKLLPAVVTESDKEAIRKDMISRTV